jgi:hypothetical protein
MAALDVSRSAGYQAVVFDRHPSPSEFRRHRGYAALIVSFSPRARTTPKSVLSLGSPSADRAL